MAQYIGSGGRTEQFGKQTLHVRENSDSTIDEMFSVLQQHQHKSGSRPWVDRNLPESFFKPPPPRSVNHSRESSRDSTYCMTPSPLPQQAPQQMHPNKVNHSRSRSSPAQLPHQAHLSLPQQQHPQMVPMTNHQRGRSIGDVLDERPQHPVGGAQVNQWSGSNPGIHYQSHSVQQQSNFSPTKSMSPVSNPVSPSPGSQHALQSGGISVAPGLGAATVLQTIFGPLPPGWEVSVTPDGELYFINHMEKTTCWFLPNMAAKLQNQGPIRITQLPPQHQQLLQIHFSHQYQPHQAAPAHHHQHQHDDVARELQRLQIEKEELLKKSEEINKREQMLLSAALQNQPNNVPTSAHNMQSITSTGLDPFLGQGQASVVENHARQSSSDSGLGGMNTYSLPRTPEHLLCHLDEMDSTSDMGALTKGNRVGGSPDFNQNLGLTPMETDISMDDEEHFINSLTDINLAQFEQIDSALTWL